MTTTHLVLAFALAAAAGAQPASRTITVRPAGTTLGGPSTAPAGWVRLRTAFDGGGSHIVVAFRLPDGVAPEALVAALDTARATPLGAVAYSGPENASAAGGVLMRLAPGRYVLACLARRDGHRHSLGGEWRVLRVTPPASARDTGVAPVAAIDVPMGDYAFLGAETWPAGERVARVRNVGKEDHLILVRRLRPGVTLRQLVDADDPATVSELVAGAARLGAGRSVYLPLSLAAGNYALICLIPHATTGMPHAEMGMVRLVAVR